MTTFNLPDLGEGLPDAEIVSWHVAVGDAVKTDDLLVSVETAKAVVEVPSPHTGVITKLYAKDGDIVATGAPLVDFDEDSSAQVAPPAAEEPAENAATVVGNMPTSSEVLHETAIAGGSRRRKKGRIKATPSVRTQAKRLGIDLVDVTPTGKNGQITAKDLESFSAGDESPARPAASRTAMTPGQAIPLRGSRRAMAQSMSMTRDQVAMCTIFDDADIHE